MNVDSGLRKQGGPAHEEVEIDANVKAGDYSISNSPSALKFKVFRTVFNQLLTNFVSRSTLGMQDFVDHPFWHKLVGSDGED